MTTLRFSLSKFALSKCSLTLLAFCLLPCLFMGRAGAQTVPSSAASTIPVLAPLLDLNPDSIAQTDGSLVTSWVDAASSISFVNATGAQQPVLKTLGLGGHATVRFAGAQQLSCGDNATLDTIFANGSYAVTVAFQTTAVTTLQTLLCKGGGGGSRFWLMLNNTVTEPSPGAVTWLAAQSYGVGGPSLSGYQIFPNVPYVMTYRFGLLLGNNAREQIYINGELVAEKTWTVSSANTTTQAYSIGGGNGAQATQYNLTGDISRILLFKGNFTESDRKYYEGLLATRVGATLASPNPAVRVVFDGNSITYGVTGNGQGANVSGGSDFPSQVMAMLGTPYYWRNHGINAIATPALITNAADQIDSQIDPKALNILVAAEETNDIAGFSVTAQVAHDHMVTYLAARKAAGWRVVFWDMLPRTTGNGGNEATRQSVNAMHRVDAPTSLGGILYTGATYCDVLVDVGSDPVLGAFANSTDQTLYYDATHPTGRGYAILARDILPAVQYLIAQQQPTIRSGQPSQSPRN